MVAAVVLGGLRIQNSVQNVSQLNDITGLTRLTDRAVDLATALQQERDISAGPISKDSSAGQGSHRDTRVVAARSQVDDAVSLYKSQVKSVDISSISGAKSALQSIDDRLSRLKDVRDSAYSNGSTITQTVSGYSNMIEPLLSLPRDVIQAAGGEEVVKTTRALEAFSDMQESESKQRAIITAALGRKESKHKAVRNNAFPKSDYFNANTAAKEENSAEEQFRSVYGDQASSLLAPLSKKGNPTVAIADNARERVLGDPGAFAKEDSSYLNWYEQAGAKINLMEKIEDILVEDVGQRAKELRADAQQDALINAAVILVVLLVGVLGSLVVARSMVRSLRRLQHAAEDVAGNRLPELVRTLADSDPQDVDLSVQPIGIDTREEFGAVSRAFDDVHREAVRLAAEQALLRGNVNAMFTNLSRRTQGLVQRQISLISELESREADPDQLGSLFKLDHLATRMRRNGENLLVLAGEEPGRRWTRPVPLVDVLRAAASEVEQYERVELAAVPAVEVIGRIVNDLVHLLAELLENATSFSSPQTRVKVTGHALPDGRILVEIHDSGIGLSAEDLAAVNERLANPPVVDVSVSRRMGLFVVGRLATRHGIRIQLRPSDSGGTTALVMLPLEITGHGQNKQGGQDSGRGTAMPRRSNPNGNQLSGDSGRERISSGTPALGGGLDLPTGSGSPGAQGGQSGTAQSAGQSASPSQAPGQSPQRSQPRASNLSGLPRRGTSGAPSSGGATHGASSAFDSTSGPTGPDSAPLTGGPSATSGETSPPAQSTEGGLPRRQPGSEPKRDQAPAAGRDAPSQPQSQSQPERQWRPMPPLPGVRQGPAAPSGGESEQQTTARPEQRAPSEPNTSSASAAIPGQRFEQPPSDPQAAQWPAEESAAGQLPAGEPPQGHRPSGVSPQGPLTDPVPPIAPGAAEERTPIFESVETEWSRQLAPGQADRMRGVPITDPARTDAEPPVAEEPQASTAQPAWGIQADEAVEAAPPEPPRQHPTHQQPEEALPWRASANDERWRQAEQVREPSADGVTSSGLPRRVPRANLVPGTAEQSSQVGPSVSRAPDDVRGRLTNLRRGVQQGRHASEGHGPESQEQ